MLNRRNFLGSLGLATVVPHIAKAAASTGNRKNKPNIIIIFTDDQGYQDLGCFGSPMIKTPHLDRMAGEGMKFTNFYSSNSVCSPSRASLLTGCYPVRVGVPGVLFPRNENGLNPNEITIPEILKTKEYTTACIGKWHLGHKSEFLPTEQGFDSYYGIPYSNDMWIDPETNLAKDILLREGWTIDRIKKMENTKTKENRNKVPLMRDKAVIEYPCDQTTITKRYTEESIKFIKANKEKPFFLYLPHTMPHLPLAVSEKFKKSENPETMELYTAVIEEIDWSVGQILDTVRKLGLEKDTLIIFSTDNGPWHRKGKLAEDGYVLRDGKFSTYEGGMRVPCIMWWPGRIPGTTECRELAATIDIMPTLACIAGGQIPQDRIIDGNDIQPLMFNEKNAKSPHKAYYSYKGNNLEAVREGDWKLRIAKPKSKKKKGKSQKKEKVKKVPVVELYNLKDDLSEKNNVAQQHPEIVSRLKKMMEKFDTDLKANSRP